MLISRRRPGNAPAVTMSATGLATCANSSARGAGPSRCRAWVIPPEAGVRSQDSSQPSQSANVPASRAATSSSSSSANSASAMTRYATTRGGSFPPRLRSCFPAASTASAIASAGTQDASTPREIQSVRRPPATTSV
jgi:hypothetical protein